MAQMPVQRPPIRIIPGPARAGGDETSRPPVIEVHVSCEADWNVDMGRPPAHNGKIYLAMIDTGAESTAVDAGLVQEIGAPLVGQATIHDFGGKVEGVPGADVRIFMPEPNVVWSCRAFLRDFKQSGAAFDLILGRSFLQHCVLHWDGPRARYYAEWVG